ncbi:MAG: hypothetical protein MPI95_03665 [Nitrosopumilus sp.]|nr:hypothetical protein [Nitrosopumilus sp.]
MPPNWETALVNRWRENFDNFDIAQERTKIVRFCQKRGIQFEDIMEAMEREPMMRWYFVKDPKKQNIYERVAAEYLRAMELVINFRHLTSRELLLAGGMTMGTNEARQRGADPRAKSIDFRWTTGTHTVFASHKYTEESGGAQDNQYRDLLDFMEEARRSTAPDVVFIAIADGPFYDTQDERLNCRRIDCLRSRGSRRVFAGRIDDVPDILAGLD